MEAIGIPKNYENLMLEKAMMIWTDDYCTEDNAMQDYGKPVHKGEFRMMKDLKTDKVFCPKCKLYAQSKNVSYEDTRVSESYVDKEKKRYLQKKSIFANKSFLNKGMKNFKVNTPEEKRVYEQVKNSTGKIADGEIMNIIMTGPPGSGKSHLAYSMAFNANEMSADRKGQLVCLFIDLNEVINQILSNFDERKNILDAIKMVDVLVIDDVGTEVGRMDTLKQSTDHTYKTLLEILNAREGVATTIMTTNLTMTQLERMYDERIKSRMQSGYIEINFSKISDKRMGLSM
ncbi:ATP-binding protein [Jeotgalibaca sp. MA1X17-3]|uniref:ATP-binding protein n=1 Tax=Jeotgalibaca sp. MA1X17-3 TaxID=2908211 RepID=UPI001F1943F2|nr:ATP-binding protein [Jeotgalibaca sp. MA1X17-3]UJF15087.1 ATP-binding protein [Jeotgalibaca sp. MA1X17-3]